jgi:hypothetical protein
MRSRAFNYWKRERAQALDEIAAAHFAVGGTGRGRRYATQHINQAYAVLVCSQFQGFCRDLHSEAVDYLVTSIQPVSLRSVIRIRMTEGRKLDRGNPNPGNLGSDFKRIGLDFWERLQTSQRSNKSRQEKLEELTVWRNAIAHQDFSKLDPTQNLRLNMVKAWRSACDKLAEQFDQVVGQYLQHTLGSAPWW